MRVLFDQGTPVPLRAYIDNVATTFELGWSELSNGELLSQAEGRFDVLVTTDRQLPYQQNLGKRRIAVVVLPYANWPKLQTHVAAIAAAVREAKPGTYLHLQLA